MKSTSIEWTDSTWNPIRGCSRVSEGCRHCYAEGIAARFGGPGLAYEGLAVMRNGMPHWTGKVEFVEKHLLDPLKWGPIKEPCSQCAKALAAGVIDNAHGCTEQASRPRRIFVNSMSDLFHENAERRWQAKVFAVMMVVRWHQYQILTKRPRWMVALLNDVDFRRDVFMAAAAIIELNWMKLKTMPSGFAWENGRVEPQADIQWPLPNVWLGVSVEDQKAADERIPLLLQTPAEVRFISAEPLLGDLKIREYVRLPRAVRSDLPFPPFLIATPGVHAIERNPHGAAAVRIDGQLLGLKPDEFELLPTLDWVICGGESGPGARPMHPDWSRSLRDQCVAAGVPFFFKQHGEWRDRRTGDSDNQPRLRMTDAGHNGSSLGSGGGNDVWMQKVGKKAAGALLDGKEWKQFPEAR